VMHIGADVAEVRTEEGKLHLFVAVDRTSKYAFAQLHAQANQATACAFLEALIAACPYTPRTVLTERSLPSGLTRRGIQLAELPKNRNGPTARWRINRFDQICRAHGIEHRLTKPNHSWTNGASTSSDNGRR
jgi:hypothetical protein